MPEFKAMIREGVLIPLEGYEKEFKSIQEDVVIKVKVTNPRSRKHLGLFFAALKCAYENWPENHEFKPECPEHLRQYVESRAGYREALTVKLTGDKGFIHSLSGAIAHAQSQGSGKKQKYVFLTNTTTDVWVVYAKSIAYDQLDQDDFNVVSQRVSEVLKAETGIGLDEYKMNMTKVC